MNTRLKTILAVGILAGFAMPASAVPMLEIVPASSGPFATPSTLPTYNYHGFPATAGLEGYYDANIKAAGSGLGIGTEFTFLYSDPNSTLNLVTNGVTHPATGENFGWVGDVVSDGSTTLNGDWVDFAIKILGGSTLTNGSNNEPVPYGASFWARYVDNTHTQVIVAVEDGMGEPGQSSPAFGDFDDLVFLITAKPVSEPATLTLLGAGLLLTGFGVRTRRRNLTKAV